jgi:hypothetical protein
MPIIYRNRDRAIIARVIIELIKTISTERMGIPSDDIGGVAESVFIGAAVMLGQNNQKPPTASSVSRTLGVPRTTVLRRLDQLVKDGFLEKEGRFYYTKPVTDAAYIDKCLKIIRKGASAALLPTVIEVPLMLELG